MADQTQDQHDEVETAPDPEEDDLDDLDDVLDQFAPKPPATTQPKPSSTAPAASGPGRPSSSTAAVEDAPDEELAKQLQAGMASLASELGEDKEMQAQFEAMMSELIAAGSAPSDEKAAEHVRAASDSLPGAAGGEKEKKDFQSTIQKTMERMQQSSNTATQASAESGSGGGSEEEMLAQMLKELGGAGGLGGEGGEEDFNKMLMGMMTQLTNKEILYEPMKELHDKFPAWMEKNKDTSGAEMERFREQQRLVDEIVGRFERKGYSDENEQDREYIVERMQKMQAAGSPPPDLVGDMSAAQEALGDLDAGCPTQ